MKFTPRPYQEVIIDHQLDLPRQGVWAGMGLGKTVSTLTSLMHLDLLDSSPALVLAPLRVASSTWPDEAAKWEHLRDMRVSAVVGTAEERRAALRQEANVYTTNYENVPWLLEHFGKHWPFRKIIADESTKLKSFRLRQGGVRAQALARVAHSRAQWFTELTGTPSPNGLQDLWGQAWFLDRGERLGHSFEAFKNRWFRSVRVDDDARAARLEPLPFAQEQIEDKMRDLCLSLDAREWFNIDAPIASTVRVELPSKARRAYDDMENKMFTALDCGAEVEAFNAASKTIKCLQIANGAIYTDDKSEAFTEVHNVKLDALESIIAEAAGMPILVAYHFKHDLARLLRSFPRGRALDKNPQTIRDWNEGRIPVLFAHPASAGHGLNLQDGGNILVFFGHWWNLEERLQILERIGPARQAQAGHSRPVFIYNIVAHDTLDDMVIARVETKREVQDLLLEALKRRKT